MKDTKTLVEFFRDTIAIPDHTILGNASLSTLIDYESMTNSAACMTVRSQRAARREPWESTADLLIA